MFSFNPSGKLISVVQFNHVYNAKIDLHS